jgi:hypothetical protein
MDRDPLGHEVKDMVQLLQQKQRRARELIPANSANDGSIFVRVSCFQDAIAYTGVEYRLQNIQYEHQEQDH